MKGADAMAKDQLIFKDAEKARDAITQQQKAEIIKTYQKWADEIGEKAKMYSHKTAPSYAIAERQMKELEKQLRATSDKVANEIYGGIKSSIYTVSEAVVNTNKEWLKSLGFEGENLDIAFNYVPDEMVQKLITGQIYNSGWSLSKSIWSDKEETLSGLYKITAGGVAQNKSIYEIAKDLERYVSPTVAKPWNLVDKDGKKIYPKQVDYNAQRLARTLVQHGYQQSFVETTKENPFIIDYIWNSNGSRACELCMDRDGTHYKKHELPMDHPNGMCTMEPNVSETLIDGLANWFNEPAGSYPEIDEFAESFGHKEKVAKTVADFIDKYGTSTKSPNAWYSSLSPMQKSEAKLLKEQSGLNWNSWYEKNIYVGENKAKTVKSAKITLPKIDKENLENNLIDYVGGGYSSVKDAVLPGEFEYIKSSMKTSSDSFYRLEEMQFTVNKNNLRKGSTFSFDDDLRSFTSEKTDIKLFLEQAEDWGGYENPVVFQTVGEIKHFDMSPYTKEYTELMGDQHEHLLGGEMQVVDLEYKIVDKIEVLYVKVKRVK